MIDFLNFLSEATKNNTGTSIVCIQGSPRTKKSCSGGNSKTKYLMEVAISALPKNVKVETIDLSVIDGQAQVRPCKGCIGTANGLHCHYPCDCYAKDDGTDDLMHEKGVYEKLEKADGFAVFSPVHWFSVSSQVKAFFDRLVCVNLTLTTDEAKAIFGKDTKDSRKTMEAELSGKFRDRLKNHYEGKTAAFFIHGDDGADDYKDRKIPLSMVGMEYQDPREAIKPIILQCKYSGIFVPDNCIVGDVFGYNNPYSQNNKDFKKSKLIDDAAKLLKNLVNEIEKNKKTSK